MIADEIRRIARLLQPLTQGAVMRREGARSLIRVLVDVADRVEALERHAVVHEPPLATLEREMGVRLSPEQRVRVAALESVLKRIAREAGR